MFLSCVLQFVCRNRFEHRAVMNASHCAGILGSDGHVPRMGGPPAFAGVKSERVAPMYVCYATLVRSLRRTLVSDAHRHWPVATSGSSRVISTRNPKLELIRAAFTTEDPVNCCTIMSMMSEKLMPSACEVDCCRHRCHVRVAARVRQTERARRLGGRRKSSHPWLRKSTVPSGPRCESAPAWRR
jgi:hypothetical protein